MSSTERTTAPTAPSKGDLRRVALSSYLGNTIEYYDFILYGSAAALIFGPLFFSDLSPALATMASFATFAAGYIARPLGGIVFGILGDRIGRKTALMATMLIMGLASGFMGLLPTYDQVGVVAPMLLVMLRIIQGFAVGGEWGGAALMTAEHAPLKSRGYYTALGQAGLSSGGLLSTLAIALVTLLPQDQLFTWGWRIPFLLSFALLAVGFYVRLRVSESPLFLELLESGKARTRKRGSLAAYAPSLLRGIAIATPPIMSSTIFGSFAIAYAVGAGHARPTVLTAACVSWGLSIATTVGFGLLSDRIGRRPVYIAAAVTFSALVYPLFLAIGSGSTPLLFIAFAVATPILTIAMSSILAATLSEMFPTEIRYTAVSASYQLAAIIAGLAPLGATALFATGDGANIVAVALMVGIFGVLAAIAAITTRESRGSSLRSTPLITDETADGVSASK